MPAKKVSMGTKPGRSIKPATVDQWVDEPIQIQEETSTLPPVKTKRLTLDIPEPLHKAIKSRSVEEGISMVDMLRVLLEENYGRK